MAGQALTPQQAKKLDGVCTKLVAELKLKQVKDAKTGPVTNLGRFADKYLRYKLKVRGTGPHAHGFNKDQRAAITTAIREAFGIKTEPRKVAVAKKPAAAKRTGGKRGGARRSTAELARQQTERAAGA